MSDVLRKLGSIAFDATLGLVKQYHEKTLQLVKLEAASFYITGVKALRKQVMAVLAMHVCLTVLAVAMVLIPVLLVLFAPISYGLRVGLVAVLGVLYIGIPAFALSKLTSEKTWLELSKSNEILSSITNGKHSSE